MPVVDAGAAVLLPQSEMDVARLQRELALLQQPEQLALMARRRRVRELIRLC